MASLVWKSYNRLDSAPDIFRIIRHERMPFFLDSGLQDGVLGRYSFLGFDPFCAVQGKNVDSLGDARKVLAQHKLKTSKYAPPFAGGAVGFCSYDFGLLLEPKLKPLYRNTSDLPDCYFAFYDSGIVVDHAKRATLLFAPTAKKIKYLESVLAKGIQSFSRPSFNSQPAEPVSNFTKPAYMQAVKRAKAHIAAGDIYQVNLAHTFSAKTAYEPAELFSRLRQLSPAAFGTYFDAGEFQIVSSSPERFIRLQDGVLQSRPMKGTRPRHHAQDKDKQYKQELLQSVKDRAELMMIVDLMRNDLGRVCDYASVHVPSLRNLEAYTTVYQTTATIEGKLRTGFDGIDVLRQCFPGGSITGCPKIRSMEIIDQLEPSARGVYTGSLGYMSFCGNMDMNILIRTMVCQQNRVAFSVGAGIVADSDPAAEYEETLVKAKGMLEALR